MHEEAPSQEVLKVLVVEDNPNQRRTLCDLLSHEGFDPVACGEARSALEVAKRERLAVAIVDLRLPDLAGTQVLDQIRQLDESVEVIIHTAYGSFDSAKDSVNLGAFAYLEKPSAPDELLRQVHRAARRWMNHALERSRERYRTLSELSPVGIFHANGNGIVHYVNQRWCEISGLSSEEVASQGWAAALHPEDRKRVLEAWYESLTERRGFAMEYRLRHKSGKTSWVYAQTTPESEGEEVVGYVGTLTDLTEQKLALESLRVLNAALEQSNLPLAVITAAPGASDSFPASPSFVYANPAFTRLTDYLEEELVGHPFDKLSGEETEASEWARLLDGLGGDASFELTLTVHRRTGEAMIADWMFDPVRDWDENLTHWVAFPKPLAEA